MSRRVLSAVALLVAAGASLATKIAYCDQVRRPYDGAAAWDPGAPLVLGFGDPPYGAVPASDTAAFRAGVRIVGPAGEVPWFAVTVRNQVVICPDGGLSPDTDYTWTVGPFAEGATNELETPYFGLQGERRFHTGSGGSEPATSEAECRALAEAMEDVHCQGDSGDTGEPDTDDTD